jgi:hypothetical protein
LQLANMKIHQQLIHKRLWTICGSKTGSKDPSHDSPEVAQIWGTLASL